eukprot:CAMPEP_0116902088 /NCGR_PEP_ID=MMETSP0467-20121206/9781_1 /TAXON_ID=283647 /ORGANISM="Mesodinium pulex, Strain SPMC105" /LENGTH=48 /DNA_ID= /DNA_START= /DNA_END= /DNA_ORIENTATION=
MKKSNFAINNSETSTKNYTKNKLEIGSIPRSDRRHNEIVVQRRTINNN